VGLWRGERHDHNHGYKGTLTAMPQPVGIHAENVVGFGTSGMVALSPNTKDEPADMSSNETAA
jgi:hypothetical protein